MPFVVRVPIGVALVALAARTGRPWLLPIGAGLCIPADYGCSFLTVWIGSLGLICQRGTGPPRANHLPYPWVVASRTSGVQCSRRC